TNLANLRGGDAVNLERALREGDRLGGHLVQGHVDAVGTVRSIRRAGAAYQMWVQAPPSVTDFLVEKGSVAIDGVSLTVAYLDADGFCVALIPHTLANTTLGRRKPGDAVNLEADVIGKYVARQLAVARGTHPSDATLLRLLREEGYTQG
ncbi:MAG: riboflavin synthase, partial [Armatimonadota bacterium]|nr:riboflavin synthase [Armatimonadota bacterium]